MSGLLDFAVSSIWTVLEAAAVTLLVIGGISLAFGVFVVVMGCYQYIQRHNLSKAYVAGAATGFLAYAIRNRLGPGAVVALLVGGIVAVIATGLTDAIEETIASTSVSGGNPPPVVSPLQESQLEYPTDVPERIERQTAPWPPFTGVRVELGGDQH